MSQQANDNVTFFTDITDKTIAILIPCFNEEVTIAKVIRDFKSKLPTATVYVYDNNSTDNTATIAKTEGAVVVKEKRQGKGFVVASMFLDIDADLYLMVDGDDTYPAASVYDLVNPIINQKADMVVGTRLGRFDHGSFRPLHIFGNRLVIALVNFLFGSNLTDIMSGYRAFNKRFVKSVPILSKGFELETQMTLQALYHEFVITEVPISYSKRPEGSFSKLSTFSDGAKVIITIFDILKAYRPFLFFFLSSLLFSLFGLIVGSIPIIEFLQTGKIEHFPSAILASGLMIFAFIAFAIGIILDAINNRLREVTKTVILTTRDYLKG